MRVLTILLVFLLCLQLTFAEYCSCYCCASSANCQPVQIESFYVWTCNSATCKPETCIDNHYRECPRKDAPGITEARCTAGTQKLFSSLLIVIGMTSLVLMIKNH
ncbi:unnamed protein product [Rotaria magnacalcarata]|uniref:Uncharacterized protein n=1 Tax=Rotaria magnacalcarata TaxID=392030 RepID=A0A817AF07_9BILA|nr:unnamed protein product [Rotaria magnacalcarata]CAF3809257.1 unnamed protein product [Rotaria magnacalcarata]